MKHASRQNGPSSSLPTRLAPTLPWGRRGKTGLRGKGRGGLPPCPGTRAGQQHRPSPARAVTAGDGPAGECRHPGTSCRRVRQRAPRKPQRQEKSSHAVCGQQQRRRTSPSFVSVAPRSPGLEHYPVCLGRGAAAAWPADLSPSQSAQCRRSPLRCPRSDGGGRGRHLREAESDLLLVRAGLCGTRQSDSISATVEISRVNHQADLHIRAARGVDGRHRAVRFQGVHRRERPGASCQRVRQCASRKPGTSANRYNFDLCVHNFLVHTSYVMSLSRVPSSNQMTAKTTRYQRSQPVTVLPDPAAKTKGSLSRAARRFPLRRGSPDSYGSEESSLILHSRISPSPSVGDQLSYKTRSEDVGN